MMIGFTGILVKAYFFVKKALLFYKMMVISLSLIKIQKIQKKKGGLDHVNEKSTNRRFQCH